MTLLISCGGGASSPVTPLPLASGTAVTAPGALASGTSATSTGLQVTTTPTLSPAFDPNITDYVVPYSAGSPVQVSVKVPSNTSVVIGSQKLGSRVTTTQINLTPGQSFSFVVNSPVGSKTYYVRSLPSGFPTWTTERPGTPQAEYYIIAPDLSFTSGTSGDYAIIADNYGVPIWWYHGSGVPVFSTLLSDGNIAWVGEPTPGEERTLNGAFVRSFAPASSIGGVMDTHELLLLANGDYLFIADVPRGPVDLSPYGGSSSATVTDNVIEEVTPGGALVWHWSALDHLSVAQTYPLWWPQYLATTSPDPFHMNSVEAAGNDFVVSFRHLNAVIEIDKASGNILWKLGGTPLPVSLTFAGDTYSNFGGQHDARVLPDGTLTLQDDGTLLGRGPRSVRYRIDPVARTATLVEQVTDPDATSSACCGSSRKLATGDWVMSWGGTPYVTEMTATGQRVFRMTLGGASFSYRAVPVPAGVLNRAALRQGMDTQFPH